MRTIRLVERADGPNARLSPAGDGRWNDTQFLFGDGDEPTDWLAVISFMGSSIRFPRNRTILIAGEPNAAQRFHPDYLGQFAAVVTTDPAVRHLGLKLGYHALPWHVGVVKQDDRIISTMNYADLLAKPTKTRLCACISSAKDRFAGHRDRLAFVARLREALGHRIDFFGRGVRDMADKAEALDAYRYHIVLENSAVPHYWTEKLADAYLRNCYPIYHGAPNLADYFDPAAFTPIDISHPDEAIATIAAILDSDLDREAASAIAEAKQRVMNRYNLLEQVSALAADLERLDLPPGRRIHLHRNGWFTRRATWPEGLRQFVARL